MSNNNRNSTTTTTEKSPLLISPSPRDGTESTRMPTSAPPVSTTSLHRSASTNSTSSSHHKLSANYQQQAAARETPTADATIETETIPHSQIVDHQIATEPHTPSISELTFRSPSTIKQGVLWIRTGWIFKSWKPYYCVLKSKALFYKKTQNSRSIAGFIDLKRTSIWDASKSRDDHSLLKSKHSFMIYHPLRKTIYLKANSEHQCKQWVKALLSVREMIRMNENEEDNELYTSSDDEEHHINLCWGKIKIPLRLPNILKHKGIVKEYVFDDLESDFAGEGATGSHHAHKSRRGGFSYLFQRPSGDHTTPLEKNQGVARLQFSRSKQGEQQKESQESTSEAARMTIDLCVGSNNKTTSDTQTREKFMRLMRHIEEEYPELTLRVYGAE